MKKAWLVMAYIVGMTLDNRDRTIPNYLSWSRRDLERAQLDLEADLLDVFSVVVSSPRTAIKPRPLAWLAARFDAWRLSGFGNFTIATVQEFEATVSTLTAHREMEIPPYTEMLLQPGTSVAFRHPEYMLVRDLGLLHDLFRDAHRVCDEINWRTPPDWAGSASENAQALARATIQTCFNLLESFTSGLAKAHLMTHPTLEEDVVKRLRSTRKPLRKRIRSVPSIIVGADCPLDPHKHPLSTIFGDIKRRRDAFVHCEPGPLPSEHGYVKETAFHDVSAESVDTAIQATHQAIREVWRFVKNADGPRWLPPLEGGRFGKVNMRLAPPDAVSGVAH